MIAIRTTCPQEIQIHNRKAKNRGRERSIIMRAEVRAWVAGKKCSCGCGRDATTAHHPRGDLYKSEELYMDKSQWEPYYHACHSHLHKGYVRCPECHRWMRPGFDTCYTCRGRPGDKRKKAIYQYRNRSKHPCSHRYKLQVCAMNGRTRLCSYGYLRAEQCPDFERRVWKAHK